MKYLQELPANNKTSSKTGSTSGATNTLNNGKEKTEKNDSSAPSTADKKPIISSPQRTIT